MKTIRIISICLMLLVSVNALVAGYLFIIDPSGSKLQISLSTLKNSPFDDFFVPGVILFIVNGVLNLLAAVFAIFQWRDWGQFVFFQGALLSGWIVVQVVMLRELYFLHYILGGIGLVLTVFGLYITKKLNLG